MELECYEPQGNRMCVELSNFLTRNLDDTSVGWPRRPTSAAVGAGPSSLSGMIALVVGDLALELPVDVEATKPQLLAALRAGHSEAWLRWTPGTPRVVGFVAHAARAAATLGVQVVVHATIPVPTPTRFERLFRECAIDCRYLTALPMACPIDIRIRCTDGGAVVRRYRDLPSPNPIQYRRILDKFDVIMIDPRHLQRGDQLLQEVEHCLAPNDAHVVAALRLGRRLERNAVSLARHRHVWSFLRYRDARQLVSDIGMSLNSSADAMARQLRDRYATTNLVIHRGPRGAVLMNGVLCPYTVHTCPVDPVSGCGAGDTLLAITALSIAAGADDRTSIRRGVAAATGLVAGLPLPPCLEELDAA